MKRHLRPRASQLLDALLGEGRYTFTREEATRRLGLSSIAAYTALHRLQLAGRLVMPRSGFYVIVDPQHRSAGTLPAEWFIHDLMQHMGKPYYVGLLSAAELHGAAHHRPQELQVVIPERTIRPVHAGNVRIRFFGKGRFDRSRTMDIKTPTGTLRASTPATTAWDLVRYPRAAGGLANVVTVLAELAEAIDETELRKTVRLHGELPVVHRLGFILERLGRRSLARSLSTWARQGPFRRLDPSAPLARSTEDRKWRLIVNAEVESEA